MSAAQAHNRYKADRIMTATPAQLIAMIYDIAIRSLESAQRCADEGQRAEATKMLLKAQDAVTELRCALQTESGDPAVDQLAGRLDSIYEYVFLRLVRATMGREDRYIVECRNLLVQLRDAWRTACVEGAQLQVAQAGVA